MAFYICTMKAVYFSLIAVLVLMAAPFTGKAGNNEKNEKEAAVITEKQVSVQYAGFNTNSVVFRVAFENTAAQKFTLIIKNEEGDILYQGKFSDEHFVKAIHLLKEETDMNPTFIIRAGDSKVERSFKITSGDNDAEIIVSQI